MRTDIENLEDGTRITLHPNGDNRLHNSPQAATYSRGYFYCDSTDPEQGPDYWWRDVLMYNHGFTVLEPADA